ncbi:aTPase, P-type (Transporting), HAD super, subfamily IC [Burkholderia pseudomallei]|nr:aTPase, P-type (Transporting), HAD super, subfamily IC [Burkholderia pseudomallei]
MRSASSSSARAAASSRWHSEKIASGAPLHATGQWSSRGARHTCDIAGSSGVSAYSCTSDQSSCRCPVPARQRLPARRNARSIGSTGSISLASTRYSSSS